MASHGYFSFVLSALVFAALASTAFSQLSPDYYDYSCPNALSAIKSVVEAAIQKERRMGASLLRLHFHDCFVNVRLYLFVYLDICVYVYQLVSSCLCMYVHVNICMCVYKCMYISTF